MIILKSLKNKVNSIWLLFYRLMHPKIQDTTIHLEYPNSTNKVEIERHQYELLGFIRKALNNFKIDLSITVNEELEKQYAYTPKEKYEKLKKKNANLCDFKKNF